MSGRREDWHLTVGLTRGGAERLLVEVLPTLAAAGRHPRVLSLKGWGPVGDDLQAAGIPVTALDGAGRGDPRPIWRLLRLLRQERPRRLHAHLARAVMAAGWACRRTATPWFAHFHSLAGSRPRWQDRLEAAAARRASGLVAVSAAVARDRAARLGLPLAAFTVVANGIDVAPYAGLPEPDSSPDRPLVAGFLGRLLVADKGLDVLLEAMALLRDEPGAAALRLEIAGGPVETAAELERRAHALGVEDRVRCLGEVASARQVLPGWDLLVLPSRREGFGLVLLEAMAAARPVVASRVGGITEVVQHGLTGLLVPPCEPARLAEALRQLAGDPERRLEMGRAGRRRAVERHGSEAVAAAWDGLGQSEIPVSRPT